jgi:hypothetical protein
MNIAQLLPTKKVTAFVLGGAVALVLFWLLGPEVWGILETAPTNTIVGAVTLIFGFIFAWLVPEGAWDKIGRHTEGAVQLPDPEEPGH